jgi:hypothetical protein
MPVFARPPSSMVIARPGANQSAMPATTPPVASVATKDGTRSRTWTMPLRMPKMSPDPIATGKPAPIEGSSCARMTLASEATAWIDRSMPPIRMTKVTPVARMNSTAVLASKSPKVSPVRKPGEPISTMAPAARAGPAEWRPAPSQRQKAISDLSFFIAVAPHTISRTRSTWSGFLPAQHRNAR